MKGQHPYLSDCQCYRCKGIRNTLNSSGPTGRGSTAEILRKRSRAGKNNTRATSDCGPNNWDDKG